MTSTATGAATQRRRVQPAATAGMTGTVLFVVVFTVQGWLRPGFRRDPAWRPLAGWTLATGVVLALGIVVLKVSELPADGPFAWKGLVQRVFLVTFLAWLFAVAARVHRQAAA